MDYETFKEKFVEDLQDRLYEQGTEVNISVHTVTSSMRATRQSLLHRRAATSV